MDGGGSVRRPRRRAQPPLGGRPLGHPPERSPIAEVTVPRNVRSREGIQVHQGHLAADEVTVLNAIPVTTPQRTLVDLAAVLRPHELAKAANQAEILRLPAPDRYRGHRGGKGCPTP